MAGWNGVHRFSLVVQGRSFYEPGSRERGLLVVERRTMKQVLKAMLLAGALGMGALTTPSPANAQDYYRYHRHSGASVYFSTGRVRVGYYRGYNRYDGWRHAGWRHRCYRYRWRDDCG